MIKKDVVTRLLLAVLLVGGSSGLAQPRWPAITQQTKPWTRWWWMGSAVDNRNLTRLLEQYQRAGLGGVEITPIYGVKGEEKNFINFLSPAWLDRFDHTLREAERLGLGVDLAQASGWPFGGPWVSPADACKYVAYQTYTLAGGEQLDKSVTYTQRPILRTVGEKIDFRELVEPVAKNPDLQRHAFDQVRFEKPLPLQTLMAYSTSGQTLDLTSRVDPTGRLNWTAPAGTDWTLYAVFAGWHGKQVERAGPGGEGDVIDHFSKAATQHYLRRFDEAFSGRRLTGLRAYFNDSYEVDDAQGESNWTPTLLAEFQKRRGYDLRGQLPVLFGPTTDEKHRRVLSDYRETLADLLLENYTQTWHDWAHRNGKIIRNQAHGSPANILDLYAATDIPEIEGTDLLRIKFASSAGNVTGKRLISSESATWDNEHFLSRLSDVKTDLDRFLLGGVNHTFYHGTNYSPERVAWPGWLFYAAVHFNPNNTFWPDFGTLNQYVARCQSFLQAGRPDNDLLVYLPIYDAYARPVSGRETPTLLQHFDGIEHGFKGLPVEKYANELLNKGYGFDFISDKQLLNVTGSGKGLQTGGVTYRAVVVPEAHYLPLATLQHLLTLARSGATVVFGGKLPTDVNGLHELARRQRQFSELLGQLQFTDTPQPGIRKATLGKGTVWLGPTLDPLLTAAGVRRETLSDQGLQYVRRRHTGGTYYFVVNGGKQAVEGWVPFQTAHSSVALYDPMTGKLGVAASQPRADGARAVYLHLQPGESCLLETGRAVEKGPAYPYTAVAGAPQPLRGPWALRFVSGGPTLPPPVRLDSLRSWTDLAGEAGQAGRVFSGTAEYTLTFAKPGGSATGWQLDLGAVAESAQVLLNGKPLATLLGPTYRLVIPATALRATNTLTVRVANGMANRIIDLDRRHVDWKTFYNINMSARLRENRGADGLFTAERWNPLPSGLLGPVTLTPVTHRLDVTKAN